MSATYNDTLQTEKDWVRFLIPDRGTVNAGSPTYVITGAIFSDGEIDAVLLSEANRWLAAARFAEMIVAQGGGVVSKSVADLSISYGDGPDSAYRGYIQGLREEGARRLLVASGKSSIFRNV